MPDVTQPGSQTPFDLEAERSGSMVVRLDLITERRSADRDVFRAGAVPLVGSRHPPTYGLVSTARGTQKLVKADASIRDVIAGKFEATAAETRSS